MGTRKPELSHTQSYSFNVLTKRGKRGRKGEERIEGKEWRKEEQKLAGKEERFSSILLPTTIRVKLASCSSIRAE